MNETVGRGEGVSDTNPQVPGADIRADRIGPGYFGDKDPAKPTQGKDDYLSGYEKYPYPALFEKRHRLFGWAIDAIRQYASEKNPVSRVVDIGGAYGFFAVALKEAMAENTPGAVERIVVADISPFALKKSMELTDAGSGRDSGPEIVPVQMNAESPAIASGSCDVVCAFDSLEHTRSLKESLAECVRILRPGGLLLVSIPVSDRGKLLGSLDQDETHWSVPSTRSLMQSLHSLGLVVNAADEKMFDTPLVLPGSILSRLLRKMGFKWQGRLKGIPGEYLEKLNALPLARGITVVAIKPEQ